ncbi:hypothetical protein PACTADRAFT_51676 [Pachysolen tannophilus NRRL Y-2460]|uniref:UBX domain-containing protein n=1 Tax=Pachysolen tannophilus NRRL Y-2460 TaxID=669874 RepID=A0A1E4TQ98_PACTA|nr:hypothetical protein PACTADRAFT_51676 [Pachysolen tannophilus NRRL Y-2460]
MDSESIDTFLAVTNTTDVDSAKNFLEVAGGDVETAITLFLENGGPIHNGGSDGGNGGNSDYVESHIPVEDDEGLAQRLQNDAYQNGESNEYENINTNNNNNYNNNNNQDEVRAPIGATYERLVDDGSGAFFHPMLSQHNISQPPPIQEMLFGSGQAGIFNQRFSSGGSGNSAEEEDDPEDDYDLALGSDGEIRQSSSVSTRSSSRRQTPHQRRLAELFSPPWDIIEKVDLNTAKNIGRVQKKWILINIQDNSNFLCQMLNRDFWKNSEIKNIVTENFIFLQYHHDSQLGMEYKNFYPFTEYPHIAVLDPKTGERLKMWSTVPNVKEWIEDVVDFLGRFSLEAGHVNPIVSHKTKVNPSTLSEEQQLDLAIRASLGKDEEIKEGVVEESSYNNPISLDTEDEDYSDRFEEMSDEDDTNKNNNNAFNDDEDDSEVIEISKDEAKSLIDKKQKPVEELTDDEVFATILPVAHEEPDNNADTTTRIQIRTGDGKRIVRRFKRMDKVRVIYEYIKNDLVKDSKIFTLTSQRTNLIKKLDETIQDAGLNNASILLEVDKD